MYIVAIKHEVDRQTKW